MGEIGGAKEGSLNDWLGAVHSVVSGGEKRGRFDQCSKCSVLVPFCTEFKTCNFSINLSFENKEVESF